MGEVGNAGDRGLLGITLHPNFAQNGYMYLLYTVDPVGGQPDEPASAVSFGRLARYTVAGDAVDPASRLVLLGHDASDGSPACSESHPVGSAVFGLDGSLFVSAGDGADFEHVDAGQNVDPEDADCELMFGADQDLGALRSQSLDSLAGKVIRIDPETGAGLPGNPFFDGDPYSRRSRIWVYGLRNPFRFTVRPGSAAPGALYISEPGWGDWEELDVAEIAGKNFGWPCFEGVFPQLAYQSDPLTSSFCQALSPEQVISES